MRRRAVDLCQVAGTISAAQEFRHIDEGGVNITRWTHTASYAQRRHSGERKPGEQTLGSGFRCEREHTP